MTADRRVCALVFCCALAHFLSHGFLLFFLSLLLFDGLIFGVFFLSFFGHFTSF